MEGGGTRAAHLLPVIVIAVISFAVYFNALSCDFVYDDRKLILENPWISELKHLPSSFRQRPVRHLTTMSIAGILSGLSASQIQALRK